MKIKINEVEFMENISDSLKAKCKFLDDYSSLSTDIYKLEPYKGNSNKIMLVNTLTEEKFIFSKQFKFWGIYVRILDDVDSKIFSQVNSWYLSVILEDNDCKIIKIDDYIFIIDNDKDKNNPFDDCNLVIILKNNIYCKSFSFDESHVYDIHKNDKGDGFIIVTVDDFGTRDDFSSYLLDRDLNFIGVR